MTHRTTFVSRLRVLTGIALVGLLSACSTIDRGTAPALETNASWAVLPFENHTETPMAGNRAAAIATALINARGVGQVKRYTGDALQETLFDGREAKRRDEDRKSTRLNSSHSQISYAVFCLKKKKKKSTTTSAASETNRQPYA